MFKTILVSAALAALSLSVSAREGTPQQSRMAACNKDAVGKKGDERKAFMKQCLSSDSRADSRAKAEGKTAAKR